MLKKNHLLIYNIKIISLLKINVNRHNFTKQKNRQAAACRFFDETSKLKFNLSLAEQSKLKTNHSIVVRSLAYRCTLPIIGSGSLPLVEHKKQNPNRLGSDLRVLVETSGLEPLTPCMSSKYSNQLSYASENKIQYILYI